MENDLFNTSNIRKPRNNLKKNGKLALKEIKSWDDKVIRIQDKGSRFVILSNNDYERKVHIKLTVAHFQKQTLTIIKPLKKKLIHGFRNGLLKE